MSKIHLVILIVFCGLLTISKTSAAQHSADFDEVYLEFRYLQLVNVTLVSYYREPDFFLPISEVFNSVLIYNELDMNTQRITGYINSSSQSFVLDFQSMTYSYRTKTGSFTVDDFIPDQFDFFVKSSLLEEIFQFEYRMDMANLTMRLYSEERLPIRMRQERLLARQRAMGNMGTQELYNPRIPRQYNILQGSFLDYNVNLNTREFESFSNSATLTGGLELLFGDFQATASASQSQFGNTSIAWNNVRWRFYNPNGMVRQVYAGNLASRGIAVFGQLTGVSATNEPLYPSRVFDEYNFTDQAPPETEVEVYINDRLFDFLRVDEQAVFNIRLPITYGINDVRIVKYAPDGQVTEVQQRLNVPFFFVPPREFYYTTYVARTGVTTFDPNPIYVGLADLAYGLNRSNTIRAKAELYYRIK
jgi:hypothetical protein